MESSPVQKRQYTLLFLREEYDSSSDYDFLLIHHRR